LPDTNIDRITYNLASVSGVNYLQGPYLNLGQREYFSNERRILNPNGYKLTHEFALGYQYKLTEVVFLDVVHNRGKLTRLRNLNAAAEYDPDNVVIRTQAQG
jgi:hypothetical protein